MSKIASKMTGLMLDTPFADAIERAQTLYFNWLVMQMNMDDYRNQGVSYFILAKLLHNIEFYWTNELDENRAADGIRLRHIWFAAIHDEADALGVPRPMYPLDALSGPCSVLEMLVALANRIESDIMQDDEIGNRAALWFWTMLCNLGLATLSDRKLPANAENIVKHAVTKMMERQYGPHGEDGGLFPLILDHEHDLRDVDIWWQAQYWCAENYPNSPIPT